MKEVLLPDHIPVNNFELIVVGAPPLKFVTLDGFDEEVDTTDLPDRTVASGGATKSIEFTATHPKHHAVEDAFLEAWFVESKLALPSYKKPATLLIKSISSLQFKTFSLIWMFPSKRKTADLDIANEGELNVNEWTFKGRMLDLSL